MGLVCCTTRGGGRKNEIARLGSERERERERGGERVDRKMKFFEAFFCPSRFRHVRVFSNTCHIFFKDTRVSKLTPTQISGRSLKHFSSIRAHKWKNVSKSRPRRPTRTAIFGYFSRFSSVFFNLLLLPGAQTNSNAPNFF